MSTGTRTAHVDLAPPRRLGLAHLALALAIISLPASMFGWDLFDWGGVVIGVPIALAAVVAGVAARRRPEGGARGIATAAVVLGAVVLLIPIVWTIVAVIAD